jgi:hypothetical protein
MPIGMLMCLLADWNSIIDVKVMRSKSTFIQRGCVMSDSDDYDAFIRRNVDRLPALNYQFVHTAGAAAVAAVAAGEPAYSDDDSKNGTDDSSSEDSSEVASQQSSGSSSQSQSEVPPSEQPSGVDGAFDPLSSTFEHFVDLQKCIEGQSRVGMSNNKRTTRTPPAWFKSQHAEAEVAWLSGTLYCHQKKQVGHL